MYSLLNDSNAPALPDYPIAYDAAKALHAAASAKGNHEFAAHWAGQGAPLARELPAAPFARELARAVPDRARAVVTLGSPFSGDPKQNHVWRIYERIAGHKVDDPPIPRITDKPPVPCLALWSRRDGIVACRSARGLDGERDREVEIGCSHMEFGIGKKATRRVVREIDSFLKNAS